MNNLHQVLSALELDNAESDLYLFLLKSGSFSVGQMAKRLGIPRSTLYTTLSRLTAHGLVREGTKKGLKFFTAESPDIITHLLSRRADSLSAAQKIFSELLPSLRTQHKALHAPPRLSVFEGRLGIENVLRDMLLYAELETCAVWPIKKMIEVLSPEFFEYHNRERIRRNLYTRAIWPQNESVSVKDFPFLGWGPEYKREIRVAPKNIKYVLGFWIYADKVAFLSSNEEGYGFIIQSLELVETLLSLFEVLWVQSEPLNFEARDGEKFIRSLNRT